MKLCISEEHQNLSGVYIIKSTATNDSYIGRAKNFLRRFKEEKSYMNSPNREMYVTKKFMQYFSEHTMDTLYMEVYKLLPPDMSILKYEERLAIDTNKPSLNCIGKRRKPYSKILHVNESKLTTK